MPLKYVSVIGTGASLECQEIARQFRLQHVCSKDLIDSAGTTAAESKVDFLANAMNKSRSKNFVIEDFPATLQDYLVFEQKTGLIPEFVLCLEVPGQQNGCEPTLLQHYESNGLLRKINPSNFHAELKKVMFATFLQNELLELSEELLRAIDGGDYGTYEKLCDTELTAFEPEAQGQLVEGLPFHKFYFDMRQSGNSLQRVSTIAAPKVLLLSGDAALVTYTRLMQAIGTPLAGYVDAYNETRLWKLSKTKADEWAWKHIHFHRSRCPTNAEFYKVNR
ncbi:calcium/calmodulin-dependent protein kinase type II subunit gamma [Selaginella moellendorffii]|uniref:calcium/calmodulin-dependent protein kinase type II subunit gamma n=1 Tax=Selaginella moellendorffii TaxID=88036 RepID=UPI000D1C5C1C|nr:calcium/calmodulin-dependent protein kinase type II subunit gamma [Selaginella moellendorffii]|eukprot:XP_024529347.1 calcium/calmodulin-dependent protein kinase type II subunit gamma [Selaginella moellendorffii]